MQSYIANHLVGDRDRNFGGYTLSMPSSILLYNPLYAASLVELTVSKVIVRKVIVRFSDHVLKR